MNDSLIKPRPNYDVFGHCVMCHRNLLTQEVIDGELQNRFHADHGHVEYLLDDGSKMRVCMCLPCRDVIDETEGCNNKIMACVVDGWKHEVETYSHWSNEKKKAYIEKYEKLKIVGFSQGRSKEYLDKKLLSFKDKD